MLVGLSLTDSLASGLACLRRFFQQVVWHCSHWLCQACVTTLAVIMNKRRWPIGCCIAVAFWHAIGIRHLQFVGGRAEASLASLPPRLWSRLRAVPKQWQASSKEITQQITGCGFASTVIEVLESEHNNPALNIICLCAAWCKLAELEVSPQVARDPFWKEFVDLTMRQLKCKLLNDPSNAGRDCSNIFGAVANLRWDQRLLRQFLDGMQEDLGEGVAMTCGFMNGQELSNSFWACGELELQDSTLQKVLNRLTHSLYDVVDKDFGPQDMCNILCAARKLGKRVPELLEVMPLLAEVMPDKVKAFGSHEVSSSLFSIAMLHTDDSPGLIGMVPLLARQAGNVLPNMTSRRIANVCWGLALCGHVAP